MSHIVSRRVSIDAVLQIAQDNLLKARDILVERRVPMKLDDRISRALNEIGHLRNELKEVEARPGSKGPRSRFSE